MTQSLVEYYTMCCMRLLLFRYAYYVHNTSIISDTDYDMLERKVKQIEDNNPDIKHPRSPTVTVGSSDSSTYPKSVKMFYTFWRTRRYLKVNTEV